MIETINQSQEKAILESFLELVKSPYGDFAAIGKLSRFLNDPATLQKIVAFLSLTPQGKQAFVDRPLLGKIDLQQLHQLPKHTLGYLYADRMIRNGIGYRGRGEFRSDHAVHHAPVCGGGDDR